MEGTSPETKRLRHNVEWALRRALDPATVLPMLHRLSRLAEDGSDEDVYAQRRLAELLAEHHPWRAALSARRVIAARPGDDGAWAILALCHALLGNYRCAATAYRRAAALSPSSTAYAHNLGHLLDVALGRPIEALPWLRAAYEGSGYRTDVAASFAHALGRSGDLTLAKRVCRRALRSSDAAHHREHRAIATWLAEGAPDDGGLLPRRPPAHATTSAWEDAPRKRAPRRTRATTPEELEVVLARGLARLPLDANQHRRAHTLASDPALRALLNDGATTSALAAAIAYAIVYQEEVPLKQAEVAACFRVSAAALRGLFALLRRCVDLGEHERRATAKRPR